MSASRGRSSETSLRLCSRAPRMISWSATVVLTAQGSASGWSLEQAMGSNKCSSRRAGLQPATRSVLDPTGLHSTPTCVLNDSHDRHRSPGPGAGTPPWVPAQLELLAGADQRLVRTVDGLDADDLRRPVPAARVDPRPRRRPPRAQRRGPRAGARRRAAARRAAADVRLPEARDADIEELAKAEVSELRERLLAVDALLRRGAATPCPTTRWHGRFERTPGGPTFCGRHRAADAAARGRDPPRRPRRRLHARPTGRDGVRRASCSSR